MENTHNSMDILWQLGRRIAFLRSKRNLSQLSLALNCNVAKSYLSDLERGRRNPTILLLNKIAVGLNVTLEELLMGIVSLESLFGASDKE